MSELDKKIKDSIRILKMGAQDKTGGYSSGGEGRQYSASYKHYISNDKVSVDMTFEELSRTWKPKKKRDQL